jgi:hypothetical protein
MMIINQGQLPRRMHQVPMQLSPMAAEWEGETEMERTDQRAAHVHGELMQRRPLPVRAEGRPPRKNFCRRPGFFALPCEDKPRVH